MAEKVQQLKVIDNPFVTELYANKMVTTSFDGGAVVITLGVMRFVSEDAAAQASEERTVPPVHVTARLAVSPAGAVELATALNTMLKTLSERQQRRATADKPNPKRSGGEKSKA